MHEPEKRQGMTNMISMIRSTAVVLIAAFSFTVHAEPVNQAGYILKFTPGAKEGKFTIGTFSSHRGKRHVQTVIAFGRKPAQNSYTFSVKEFYKEHKVWAVTIAAAAVWGIYEATENGQHGSRDAPPDGGS